MAKPWIGVIVRANRSIGTGHLMRIKPLLPKLKAHAQLTLYVYAFDEALRPLCAEYDEIKTFAKSVEEAQQRLLNQSYVKFKAEDMEEIYRKLY